MSMGHNKHTTPRNAPDVPIRLRAAPTHPLKLRAVGIWGAPRFVRETIDRHLDDPERNWSYGRSPRRFSKAPLPDFD